MASYEIGKLVWQITGDTSGIDKSLKNANKSADDTGKKFAGLGGIIAKTFAIGAVVMFGKTIAKAGSDAQETAQKFGVVFSTIQDDAQKTAKSLAQEFNFSNNAAMELLAGTGNLLEGLGYTQTEALKMSESIAQLGSDLTSMNNYAGGAAEATRILTKAMLGEREALQALDIKVTDDQLRAYAKSLGTTWDALTQAEKAQATFNIITAQSANAIGDVERSGGSAAFIWRKLNNTWDNIISQLGEELIPGLVYFGQTALGTAEDSGPLLDTFKLLIKLISNTIIGLTRAISLFMSIPNVAKGLKLSVDAITSSSKAEAAQQEYLGQLYLYRSKYQSEATAQNKNFITVMQERAKAGDKMAASELAYLDKLKSASADAADASKNDTSAYLNNLDKLSAAYGGNIDNIKKEVSERTKIRKKEAEDAKKQFLKSQEFMGGGGKKEKEDYSDLIEQATKYGNSLKSVSEIEKYQNELRTWALTLTDKEAAAVQIVIDKLEEAKTKAAKFWDELSNEEKLQLVNNSLQAIGSGLISVLQAAEQLSQQVLENRLANLDEQMQAELEAAGVAEETAVQKAQREVNDAGASVTVEQTKALQKAQIEEKYQKKRKQLEYEAAMAGWELQVASAAVAVPLAIMNALVSGWAAAKLNPTLAIWYPALLAGLAGAAAGIQLGAVVEAKPQPPKFATGGIIPGSTQGTKLIAGENNKTEVIMNQDQMANTLMAIANGNTQGGYRQVPPMSDTALWSMIFKASQNGDLFIAENAVVSK